MKTISVEQIQELDRMAIERLGIPSLDLMEHAGRACVGEILKSAPSKVTLVCGLGNNAGDGFVIARHLKNHNVDVDIFVVGDAKKFSHDAKINYSKIHGKVTFIYDVADVTASRCMAPLLKSLSESDLTVDALFGVGLTRTIEDPFKSVIEYINEHAQNILSVDMPSGLDGTTGQIYGVCIQAHKTVTFTFAKQGMLETDYSGEIIVVDIGIPKELQQNI